MMYKIGLGLLLSMMNIALYAGTHYQLTVPSKPMPYCERMPFDYVEKNIVIHEVYNRIVVKQPVQLQFARQDYKALTGLLLWSPKGRVQETRLADKKYQYKLQALPTGEVYELRGMLKYPAKSGFQICVSALSH